MSLKKYVIVCGSVLVLASFVGLIGDIEFMPKYARGSLLWLAYNAEELSHLFLGVATLITAFFPDPFRRAALLIQGFGGIFFAITHQFHHNLDGNPYQNAGVLIHLAAIIVGVWGGLSVGAVIKRIFSRETVIAS